MHVIRKNVWEVRVPAGTYVLGDPCYCFPSELTADSWDELGESSDWFEASPVATIDRFGKLWHVLGFGTAWGDGEYRDQYGNRYPVDAGLIGLVPIELVKHYGIELDSRLQRVVAFNRDVTCKVNEGDMWFGEIHIDTRDEGDYD